jgi:hypothetical protein
MPIEVGGVDSTEGKPEQENTQDDPKPEEPKEDRADPFANLELPPPVGSDGDDWSEEPELPSEDHSALTSAAKALKDEAAPRRSRQAGPSLDLFGESGGGLDGGFGGFDGGLSSLNDPSISHLEDPPFLSGRTSGGDLFGNRAQGPMGRATSPKLFAQASQFPTCHQLRCWKWENGIPVGLGVIDAQSTEEDMVQEFYDAMPRPTQGKAQFKLRPIDINGQEMGQEITLIISEHHAALKRIRDAREYESQQKGEFEYVTEDPAATMASQMSQAYDRMFQMTEKKQDALERTLQMERDRMRDAEMGMAQERIDLATNTAQGIQVLTERMMNDEAQRSERSMKQQSEQSQLLISTLTQIFSQQQSQMSIFQEQQRQADEHRLEQERSRAVREREEVEARRRRDQEEFERRRLKEEAEFERKWKHIEEEKKHEREQLVAHLSKEKEDSRLRAESDSARLRQEIEHTRLRMEQERINGEARMQREREQYEMRMKHEREDAIRRENERKDELRRQEEHRRQEHTLREKQLEVQAQRDREHQERLLQMSVMERESQREGMERRDKHERELRAQAEVERKRQHELMLKELEISRERDREHSQKMLELSKIEINARKEDSITSFLPKVTGLLKDIGLEPAEVIQRVLGGGGGDFDDDDDEESSGSSGWLENIPKLLGAAGDVAKLVMATKGGGMGMPPQMPPHMAAPPRPQPPPRPRPRNRRPPQIHQQPNFQAPPRPQPQPQRVQQPPQQVEPGVVRMNANQLNNPPPMQPKPQPQPQNPGVNLPLKTVKKARNAVRKMVVDLMKSDKAVWQEKLTAALMQEPTILEYIMQKTVYHTVIEGGGNPEFALEFIGELKSSGLVPKEIPLGEPT